MTSPAPTSLVLTVLSDDRPGLVERLSQTLAAHHGNWVESRMAHLAGQFAGILRVELPSDQTAAFRTACSALAVDGLRVSIAESRGPASVAESRVLRLELVGQDRPGIVREISHVLAQNGINVEELTTGVESAPMSAEMLFHANARLSVPLDLPTERLRRCLEPIGNDLMVDFALLPSK
ncbi:MAG: glycine cleavage system protein R [Myxococcales bacterium]